MEMKIVYPAIYKHFKNKYYATMGIIEHIQDEQFWELSRNPNIIFFNAEYTENGDKIPIIRNKGVFYTTNFYKLENCVLYKSLYDGHVPYIRPIETFLSKVDKEKYPNILQEYKFTLVGY